VGYGSRYRAAGAAYWHCRLRLCGRLSALAPTGTPVLVDGIRTGTVGAISMDMLTVDLTPCPQAGIGTPVELWGNEIKIDEVAACAGTVGYELMCALAPRVPVVTV
jgi:alanine racemase